METTISKSRMDEVMSWLMTKRIADMRSLLANNGVDTSSMSDSAFQIAFLKAIKDSPSFRSDVSAYLSDYMTRKSNFVNQPMLNAVEDIVDIHEATAPAAPTPAPSSKGSFWDTLGSLASPSNLNSLFNTGLGVVSNSLQNKANQQSEQNALQLEQLRLQQIQAQKDLAAQQANQGLPGWAIGLIVVGGVGLIVGIILLVRPKKS